LCLLSFVKLVRTDLGFDPSNLTIVNIQANSPGQSDMRSPAAWEAMLERVRQIPGVESASLSRFSLFVGAGRNKSVRIPGQAIDAYDPWYLQISPGFLATMRISLVAGRDFEWRDARPELPSAVIVNESFARRYFPAQPALGQRFFRVDGGATLVAQEIIGVAADAKYTNIREIAPPTVYDPFRPEELVAAVQVRTRLETATFAALLRDELPRVHPAFRVTDVTRQSTLVDNHLVRDRALALLSAFFSVAAIVLVAVGLYGVLSYTVLLRTREIGIRLALGARPVRIVSLVVSEMSVVTTIGLILGAAGGIAAARFITALLYDVRPWAPSSMAAPLGCLIVVCALASAIPAVRATRVDPTSALRCE
jgi:predicted permease